MALDVVLVVSDDNSREVLARLLANEGLRVRYEADTRNVAKHLANGCDCVVVEVLPGTEAGFDNLKAIRDHRDESVADAVVVVSSERDRAVDRLRAWEGGCDAYLAKPYHVRDLAQVIGEAVERPDKQRLKYRKERFDAERRRIAEEKASRR